MFTAMAANLSKKIDGDVRPIFSRQNIVIFYFVFTFRLVTAWTKVIGLSSEIAGHSYICKFGPTVSSQHSTLMH